MTTVEEVLAAVGVPSFVGEGRHRRCRFCLDAHEHHDSCPMVAEVDVAALVARLGAP